MVDAVQVKNRIVEFLKTRGPSLPIQIAKAANMNSLFISAFLSELGDDKRIKISFLKVGGSPLYFLEGQEADLEKFCNYLHPKEAEAFFLLKKNKVLKDSEQDPAIRVALRSIKDFAIGFRNNEEIYWRYAQFPESEVSEKFFLKETPVKEIAKEVSKEIKKEEVKEVQAEILAEKIEKPIVKRAYKPRVYKEKKEKEEFQNPLVIKKIEKPKKEKPKSEFVLKVIDFINKNQFEILEEKEYKAKEYKCKIRINSDLGHIDLLTLAKDKKIISDSDLRNLLSESQSIPLSAFMIYTGNLNKKARDYIGKYSSILKAKKLNF